MDHLQILHHVLAESEIVELINDYPYEFINLQLKFFFVFLTVEEKFAWREYAIDNIKTGGCNEREGMYNNGVFSK